MSGAQHSASAPIPPLRSLPGRRASAAPKRSPRRDPLPGAAGPVVPGASPGGFLLGCRSWQMRTGHPTNSFTEGRQIRLFPALKLVMFLFSVDNDSVTNEAHAYLSEDMSPYAAARTQACGSLVPGGACRGSVERSAHVWERRRAGGAFPRGLGPGCAALRTEPGGRAAAAVMGKLNVVMLRYLSREHFRVLTAVRRPGCGQAVERRRRGGLPGRVAG